MSRKEDVDRLYEILNELENAVGGKRKLENCDGRMDWPRRGVYFFFDPREERKSTDELRVTRVGTHAVSRGSETTLWDRLKTHRGTLSGKYAGGGNHRGSVFRKEVGRAIIAREGGEQKYPDWGEGSSAEPEVRKRELDMEKEVSKHIRNLPFLWIKINDKPGAGSKRAFVERNSIALLSNFGKEPIDPREQAWLGNHSPKRKIRESGLWNVDYVDESYKRGFLEEMRGIVRSL
ncbi:hypothetical protein AKJ58_01245 [candidate division MSBL1 archaeon SCGC-AAA385D11]|uniref:GIY-YIG domain-containing protein n=1 Tax=candidate division MSBL1 archaeon SCGC-AAA385D11 TaxID=1698286 RepID=A0A133VNH2_9EURY|nr:hypothetical protein AKJ58_01245 [candidate division MSBL1 archaeon SCGC-AAA385D11]